MWKRYYWIAPLLAALLLGCGQTRSLRSDASHQERPDRTDEADLASRSPQVDSMAAEPNGVVTLGQVWALTLLNNPRLQVFSFETRAAEARALQAGLRPNPTLEIGMEGIGGSGDYNGLRSAETVIQLSQAIELGRQAHKRLKVARFETTLANLDYQTQRRELLGKAAQSFYELLKAQEQLQLAHELTRLARDTLATVEKRVEAGKDSPLEQSRAAVALAAIGVRSQEAQRNLDFARTQLAAYWGQEHPLFQRAGGDLTRIVPQPDREVLLARLKLNPLYTRWETEIAKNQAALTLEKARALGEVTVSGGLQRFNDTDDTAMMLGVAIPLPVANRNQGARQEAGYLLAQAHARQKAAWLELVTQFNEACRATTNAASAARSLQEEVLPGAQALYEAALRGYREGKADYLSVLDAQRTLFEIKNELIESLAAYHSARIELGRLTGPGSETIDTSDMGD